MLVGLKWFYKGAALKMLENKFSIPYITRKSEVD
jgi:hypothetical protein